MLSTEELLALTQQHAVPASAIRTIADVVGDPQVEASGMLRSVGRPQAEGYRDVSLPLRIDGARPRAEATPPASGEQTREVLRELGFDDDDVTDLLSRGVAQAPP